MTFALTDAGLSIETADEILARLAAKARAPSGVDPNLDTSELSPIGRLLGVLAIETAALQKVVRDTYTARTATAAGQALADTALLTGTVKRKAAFSTVGVSVELTAGTTIPAGSRANVAGDTTAIFAMLEDVTNSSGITATLAGNMVATVAGPVRAPAGTLTVINTPVSGWLSVTNAFDATIGSPIESDPDLRLRREQELDVSGSTVVLAIESDVAALDAVLDTANAENLTNLTDANGLAPHSFEIIVWDGVSEDASNDAIAQAIFDAKPAGIASVHGTGGTSVSGTAVDTERNEHAITFTRASTLDVYMAATVIVIPTDYPVDGDDQIKAALAAAFNDEQHIGANAYVSRYYDDVYAIAGVYAVTLTIGTAPAPVGASVAVTRSQIAVADTSRIAVSGSA